jgi:hypothetical protein
MRRRKKRKEKKKGHVPRSSWTGFFNLLVGAIIIVREVNEAEREEEGEEVL